MERKSFLSGKRFLICQPMIRGFCGSTMATLELAKYLLSVGAEVLVYTNIAFPPALDSFKKAKIKVVSSMDKFDNRLRDFDYIWIHSLTIPREILDEFKKQQKVVPAFIFLHMSPLESIPDEHPWIFDLENNLSSLSLYISDQTLKSNEKYGLPDKVGFFRNPAPVEFRKLANRNVSQTLKKLLIVSNHPPVEVIEAKKILIDAGVEVDIYGEGQDEHEAITPETIKKYDAVLTIGKTVQYCIVGLVPVYIYDWFGGPGWLTASNYKHSKANNFSGRFSVHKTGNKIAQEIIDGYRDALDYYSGVLSKDINEYSIDYVLDDILKDLKPRKIKPLNSEYIESVKSAVYCAEIRFIASEELGNTHKRCSELIRKNDELTRQNQELARFKDEYHALINSKRMKLMNFVLKPYTKIKKQK